MDKIPNVACTPVFSAEDVKLVATAGMSLAKAADRLSIPKSSLSHWVRAARAVKLRQVGERQGAPTELEFVRP
jgi:transposase